MQAWFTQRNSKPSVFILKGKKDWLNAIFLWLAGYPLFWGAIWWLCADIEYIQNERTTYTTSSYWVIIGFGSMLFYGWIIPFVCYWFKAFSWKLSWLVMLSLYILLGLVLWLLNNTPSAIIKNTFGHHSTMYTIDAFITRNYWDAYSYQVFRIKGDAMLLQKNIEEKLSYNNQDIEKIPTERIPSFLYSGNYDREILLKKYSNEFYSWVGRDGFLYIYLKGQSLSEVSQKFHTRLRSKRVKGYGAKDTASMYSN
ncbi:hypothetical protein [Victivallis vadensis]|uniref:hypothetical protein n=1 Tax=Victivallis vadensis TaxID=172901 RepID=UPI000ECF5A41|nr:hypothetical protein [Victivallis vadensis]HCG25337.1 hypothetical protein [Lentisphaeria bacterium]HCG48759.1 hypothetical protein [Lentisphaeria bacterium]